MSHTPSRLLRVAIGQVFHETNTFIPRPTTLGDFHGLEWRSGEELLAAHAHTHDSLGGMLDAAARVGVEAVPTFAAAAEPGGLIAAETHAAVLDALLAALADAGPLDAVCLSLHGAGVAAGVDDLEGDLLARVRALVGERTPITVTLDLHANVTPAMLAHATVLVGCHLYPHTDLYACGQRAVELAAGCARGRLAPVSRLQRVPLLMPPATTDDAPMADVLREVERWAGDPRVLHCAVYHGFSYTDTPDVGASVSVTTDGDALLAQRVAATLAETLWTRRQDLPYALPDATAAVAAARSSAARPVVLAEVSDNPGGGSPGDGTHLLRAMLDAGLADACFGFIYDPDTALQAHVAGAGVEIDVRLGAREDAGYGDPIVARATVRCLTDGRFRATNPMLGGRLIDLGPSARLRIGTLDVIVASRRTQTFDPELFLLHGIDVRRCAIVALKSSHHYRAGFRELAGEIIGVDTGGATSPRVSALRHERIRRPIWPLDAAAGA